jgi:hypothetical protein
MTTVAALNPVQSTEHHGRVACWDPVAECTLVMAKPAAEPELFAAYHRGAVANYARFGVSDALDSDLQRCADDTALFWTLTDLDGRVVGGVRAKGPLLSPEESHAMVEWAGQPGEAEVREMIAERIPLGILEMKAAWLDKDPTPGRLRSKMIWWDRRTFAVHGEREQVAAIVREMAQVQRSTQSRPPHALYRAGGRSTRWTRQPVQESAGA